MRYGAPELTLTAYVQLRDVDGASGSGSVQLEFAFSKTQLQDCLTRLASAIMDDIKVFLVSLSEGSTLLVGKYRDETSQEIHNIKSTADGIQNSSPDLYEVVRPKVVAADWLGPISIYLEISKLRDGGSHGYAQIWANHEIERVENEAQGLQPCKQEYCQEKAAVNNLF